jgi:hypothetical protein
MKVSGHKQVQAMQAYVQKESDKAQFKKLNKKIHETMKEQRLKRQREEYQIENLKSPSTQRL